jgi:hypothetical protein
MELLNFVWASLKNQQCLQRSKNWKQIKCWQYKKDSIQWIHGSW